MALTDYFLEKQPDTYSFAATPDNEVAVFNDNAAFFASILQDLNSATDPEHFIYFAGWWSDIDIPLGDPKAQPTPPTLRDTLSALAKGTPKAPGPVTPVTPPENNVGPEVCCMEWQQKGQMDWSVLLKFPLSSVLPDSIFGAPILASINTTCVQFVNYLGPTNKGILDKATLVFGSHHQKFIVIRNASGLVAYVGSSDFNEDRLYRQGDTSAIHPPTDKGAPLNDVNVRVVGPAASDLLTTFVDRWSAHADGKNWPLAGASFAPSSNSSGGGLTMQVTHTYGAGYPFPNAVRSAADAQIKMVQSATQYIYYEDQYLIGTPEIKNVLSSILGKNKDVVVIGVMAPAVIVSDLRWIAQRRADFWASMHTIFDGRVLLFEMLNNASDNGPGAYLHNKMTIVDDEVVTVGSVNFSRRSWTHDSEVMVIFGGSGGTVPVDAPGDDNVARKVRLMRWARHLGQAPASIDRLPDALARWRNLPPTAQVRPWMPFNNSMLDETYKIYTTFYDVFADPA